MSRALLGALLTGALAVACSDEESLTRGLTEPLRIEGAQFREGDLPSSGADDAEGRPAITLFQAPGSVAPGLLDKRISGRASAGSASVGVRFQDIGTGYWVLPTESADLEHEGELFWGGAVGFGRPAVAGKHTLLGVAFDGNGKPSAQVGLNVCLLPEVPDNGNICDPAVDPPKLVVSLAWNSPVDLDLRVITPSGKIVDSKRPTSAVRNEDGVVDPTADGVGQIQFDSNAGCELDGQQRENLVFQTRPAPGRYLVYANLFEACGEDSVEFTATLHSSVQNGDHFKQAETLRASGALQAIHANSGTSLGTFLTQFVIK